MRLLLYKMDNGRWFEIAQESSKAQRLVYERERNLFLVPTCLSVYVVFPASTVTTQSYQTPIAIRKPYVYRQKEQKVPLRILYQPSLQSLLSTLARLRCKRVHLLKNKLENTSWSSLMSHGRTSLSTGAPWFVPNSPNQLLHLSRKRVMLSQPSHISVGDTGL